MRPARHGRDRAPATSQPRRDVERGPGGGARGLRLDGTDAGDRVRAALRTGDAALRLAGQAARAPARDDRPRRRAGDPVHVRRPDRHRRDAARTARGAGGDRRPGPPVRPRPGGDRPELPRQAGDEDGRPSGAVARRPAVDRGRRATDPAGERPRPVPAEPELRRLPAPPRRRHRRLGRDLAGHRRPREPGGAVAGDRATRRGDGGRRPLACAAARCLPRVRVRAVDRSRRDAPRATRVRR